MVIFRGQIYARNFKMNVMSGQSGDTRKVWKKCPSLGQNI